VFKYYDEDNKIHDIAFRIHITDADFCL
jgi:hypothetical protein